MCHVLGIFTLLLNIPIFLSAFFQHDDLNKTNCEECNHEVGEIWVLINEFHEGREEVGVLIGSKSGLRNISGWLKPVSD